MTAWGKRSLGCLGVLAVLAILIPATSALWLPLVGTTLEHAGPPHKADMAVVLGGDAFGNRILKAAQLARDGYVPKVFVSGPSGSYGFYECELAIAFAVKRGFPESMFICGRNESRSTQDEATMIVGQLRRLGVHSFILVTSDYHTGRAGRLFRRSAPDMQIYVVGSPDKEFSLDRWWQTRQGRKEIVMEWTKTVATWFGL